MARIFVPPGRERPLFRLLDLLLSQETEEAERIRRREERSWLEALPATDREAYQRCATFPGGFYEFLRHWHFTNRETGEDLTFATLWPGQEAAAAQMIEHPWLFLLKAGKLGFTELECAWDAYVLRFRQRRARVNIFSKDRTAAEELVALVRYGLLRLPPWMGVELLADQAGGDTLQSLKVRPLEAESDDVRSVVSFAASSNPSIDVTATHAHVDELSHMLFARELWGAVSTTVAPTGTLHVVSRGAGDDRYTAELWRSAMVGRDPETFDLLPGRKPTGRLKPFFVAWTGRPDRDREWYELEKGTRTLQRMLHFAPATPEDALAGDATATYIPVEVWNRCHDRDLPPLLPGDPISIVLSADAAVSGDGFAVVAISRHPDHAKSPGVACSRTSADPAVRASRLWMPPAGGSLDYLEIESWIRFVCNGGCGAGHPRWIKTEEPRDPRPNAGPCEACADATSRVPSLNVVQITYDPYQLHDMMTRLRRDGVAWCDAFPQTTERLLADAQLRTRALSGSLAHHGDPQVAEHISNAKAEIPRGEKEESKMRIVKRAPEQKVDLAVAISQGVKRVLDLNIG